LPQMRDHGAASENLRGSATGAVELGAEKPTIAIASPLRIRLHRRLPARTKEAAGAVTGAEEMRAEGKAQ
jgi:hypothetical protein